MGVLSAWMAKDMLMPVSLMASLPIILVIFGYIVIGLPGVNRILSVQKKRCCSFLFGLVRLGYIYSVCWNTEKIMLENRYFKFDIKALHAAIDADEPYKIFPLLGCSTDIVHAASNHNKSAMDIIRSVVERIFTQHNGRDAMMAALYAPQILEKLKTLIFQLVQIEDSDFSCEDQTIPLYKRVWIKYSDIFEFNLKSFFQRPDIRSSVIPEKSFYIYFQFIDVKKFLLIWKFSVSQLRQEEVSECVCENCFNMSLGMDEVVRLSEVKCKVTPDERDEIAAFNLLMSYPNDHLTEESDREEADRVAQLAKKLSEDSDFLKKKLIAYSNASRGFSGQPPESLTLSAKPPVVASPFSNFKTEIAPSRQRKNLADLSRKQIVMCVLMAGIYLVALGGFIGQFALVWGFKQSAMAAGLHMPAAGAMTLAVLLVVVFVVIPALLYRNLKGAGQGGKGAQKPAFHACHSPGSSMISSPPAKFTATRASAKPPSETIYMP